MKKMTQAQREKSLKCLAKVIESMPETERDQITISYLKASMARNGWTEERIDKFIGVILPKERNGKQKEFFSRVGINTQSFSYWIKKNIPKDRCEEIVIIAKEVDVFITKHDLRPDIFDKEGL